MRDLRVAAVSTKNRIGEPERATREMRAWCRKAVDAGAEFVVFPELNISGYFHSTGTLGVAEPVPGPATDRVIAIAEELGTVICFGLLENDADVVYNTQVIVSGAGILGKQRKIHMPGNEYLFWRSGFAIEPIDIGKAVVGITICYDSTFMEMVRTLFYRGAEVLVMPFAYDTPGPRKHLPSTNIGVMGYRVNCESNGMFGIVCNNAGRRKKTAREGSEAVFPGWAGVFGPRGDMLAWTDGPGHGEAMVTADLHAKALYERRRDQYFVPRCLMPDRYATIGSTDQTCRPGDPDARRVARDTAPWREIFGDADR